MSTLNKNSLQYDVNRILDIIDACEVDGEVFIDKLGRVHVYITKDAVKIVIPDIDYNRTYDYTSLMLSNMSSVILEVMTNRLNIALGFVNFKIVSV